MLGTKNQAMIVGVTLTKVDFVFPHGFKLSRGLAEKLGLVHIDFSDFSKLVRVQVGFLDNFNFTV